MLSFKKVRISPQLLYLASISTLLGFITNRLNIALIGFETYVGHHYAPSWTEPIFPAEESHPMAETRAIAATPVLGHAGD